MVIKYFSDIRGIKIISDYMKKAQDKPGNTGRREFLSTLSAATAAGLLNPSVYGGTESGRSVLSGQTDGVMPEIPFGPYSISRLVCCLNNISGNDYQDFRTFRHMQGYFTPARAAGFLMECEKAGINAHQVTLHDRSAEYLRLLREKGSGMKIISISCFETESIDDVIRIARPVAIVHHGGVTDRLFARGRPDLVHDYIKAVKDKGLLAGISAHNPDCISQIADEGWEVDFFTTSFYFLTRNLFSKNTPVHVTDAYRSILFRDDPSAMIRVMKSVKQPCLAFKVLAGGRLCANQEIVRAAFSFALNNIKPTDGIMVGMSPFYFDEVRADVRYTCMGSSLAKH
jgi:hypothetical protein